MTLLILFSTIGINIVSTLCGGCETEHTTFVIAPPETTGCACCADANTEMCCSNANHNEEESHSTKSVYAQLKELMSEQKSKSIKWVVSEISLFLVASQISSHVSVIVPVLKSIEFESPPLTGRIILTLHCILRN